MSESFSWALDAEALCDRFLRFHVFRHGWGLCTCGEKEWPGEDFDPPFDPRDPAVNPIGAAKAERFHFHIGRSWLGHPLEDDCPCGKAACGLVDSDLIDPDCPQHALTAAKTMRQMHTPADCPGASGKPDLVIDLDSCARCGAGHPGLELRTFSHPADTGRGIIFTHWGLCPATGEPILHASGFIYPAPLEPGKEPEE